MVPIQPTPLPASDNAKSIISKSNAKRAFCAAFTMMKVKKTVKKVRND